MDQQTKDPDVLNVLVLERVDRTKNMVRHYVLSVEPWSLVKLAARLQSAAISWVRSARASLPGRPGTRIQSSMCLIQHPTYRRRELI
jgi:hypothetical protein